MKIRQFFKSTAFRSAAVLCAIMIASGALLAIMHDLLAVSPAERRARVFKKLYGGNVTERTEILSANDAPAVCPTGSVTQAYYMSDGSYAVQAVGTGGFSNGTVTVWVILSATGAPESENLALLGIQKVALESNDKQSYIGRFTEENYLEFTKYNEAVSEGLSFGDDISIVKTGASAPYTFAALKNAVNSALGYFRTEIAKEEEGPAWEYGEFISLKTSSAAVEEDAVRYLLSVKGNSPAGAFVIAVTVEEEKITAYEIRTNGSTTETYIERMPAEIRDGSYFIGKQRRDFEAVLGENGAITDGTGNLTTGATRSVECCVRAALFACANYRAVAEQGGLQ